MELFVLKTLTKQDAIKMKLKRSLRCGTHLNQFIPFLS